MCGIVYQHSLEGKPVNDSLLTVFDKQRNRGTEGFGLFDGLKNHIVKTPNENKIIEWLCKFDSSMLLFHHRYPTSTINTKRTAHPHSTGDYFGKTQYVLVHNGVISNDEELHEAHAKMGITYGSETEENGYNDSEALLWDVALVLEGKRKKLKARGGIAFICIKVVKGKPEKLYFGRNSDKPLKMFRRSKAFWLSSEGLGDDIKTNTLYTYNYALKRLTTRHLDIPLYAKPSSNYSWKGYTHKPYAPPSYEYNAKSQMYLPNWLYGDDEYDGGYDEDNLTNYYSSDDEDVLDLKLEYLLKYNGNFEGAYWALESAYCDHLEIEPQPYSTDSVEWKRQNKVYERTMTSMQYDEEYIDETSVSSAVIEYWEEQACQLAV
jgi:hypothetical protein